MIMDFGSPSKIVHDVMLRYHVDQVMLVSVPCYKQTQPFVHNKFRSCNKYQDILFEYINKPNVDNFALLLKS